MTRRGARSFLLGSLAIAAALFAAYALTWRSFGAFTAAIDECELAFCDFVKHYYPMGEAVFRTARPDPAFFYSPFVAILLAGFPAIGFGPAVFVWGALQVAGLALYLWLFRRLVPVGLGVQLLFVALALSSFPVLHNLKWGQVSVFTTVSLLGLLALHERGRRAGAAALLAFAASFKFLPAAFLAPYAARRDSRFLLFAAAALAVFFLIVPGIALGFGATFAWYGALANAFAHSEWVTTNINSQHAPHVALRLAYLAGGDWREHLPLLRTLSYAVVAANLAFLFLVQRARPRHADLWCFQILFLTIPFALKTTWPHDLVFLPFAQAFLAGRVLEWDGRAEAAPATFKTAVGSLRPLPRQPRRLATAVLLLPSIAASNIFFFNLYGNRWDYGFRGYLFFADLLLLVAVYVDLLPGVLRPSRRAAAGPLPV